MQQELIFEDLSQEMDESPTIKIKIQKWLTTKQSRLQKGKSLSENSKKSVHNQNEKSNFKIQK